ncbi:MAG TPA: hypothetical protein VE571_00300, partial [Solirubrobacteraceae bacterium]|nr:hypothetical protein [Solirubrobacteraceae bacterium]
MKTGSLSRRTVIATLGVLVLALGGFATLITLRYRDGLRARARSQLLAGARALQSVPVDQVKPLIASLALEGINADVNVPALGAQAATSPGSRSGDGAAGKPGAGTSSTPGDGTAGTPGAGAVS